MDTTSAKERILQASLMLFATKGYKKTTTKLIAKEADVNEVTIFRLFGKKKNIVEEVIQSKVSHMNPVKYYFANEVQYDLQEDLFRTSLLYFNAMSKNMPLMMSLLDEMGQDFERIFSVLPNEIIAAYKSYFDHMYEKGIVSEADTDYLARSFTTTIVGLAVTKAMTNEVIVSISNEAYIKKNAEIFAKGISR